MAMVAFALIVALTDLALGFYIGLLLAARSPSGIALPWPWRRSPRRAVASAAERALSSTPVSKVVVRHGLDALSAEDTSQVNDGALEAVAVPQVPSQEIPQAWLELLDDVAETRSFVEASVKVLKLEVGRYRDHLVDIEETVRLMTMDADALQAQVARINGVNETWLVRQAEATQCLQESSDQLGSLAHVGARLEEVLVNQTAQIESSDSNLRQLVAGEETQAAQSRLLVELQRLLTLAHELRDAMAESMAAILAVEDRLTSVNMDSLKDELTGLWNRAAQDRKLCELLRDDPARQRTVSFGLLDIDHFQRLNSRWGTLQADAVLAALGRLTSSLVRVNRGDDAVFRHAGERFGLFLGDTGPRAATSAVERIRQTIEATTFQCGGEELSVTLSAGVTEVRHDEPPNAAVQRAERLLRSAKQAGRNCTMLDDGAGVERVDPPTFKVNPRAIRLG